MRRAIFAFIALTGLTAATIVASTHEREAGGQTPAYQRLVDALRAGEVLHMVDAWYEKPTTPPAVAPKHALPEAYTSELWLRYAGDKLAMQCDTVLTPGGAAVQTTRYEAASGQLVTTYASDGTTVRLPYLPYTIPQIVANIAAMPAARITPTSAGAGVSGPIAVEEQLTPQRRRVNYYDRATGEYAGADEWTTPAGGGQPVLTFRLRRTFDVIRDSPALQRCLGSGAQPSPTATPATPHTATPTPRGATASATATVAPAPTATP